MSIIIQFTVDREQARFLKRLEAGNQKLLTVDQRVLTLTYSTHLQPFVLLAAAETVCKTLPKYFKYLRHNVSQSCGGFYGIRDNKGRNKKENMHSL